MRFSAQEEYGLRCLMQIARDPTGMSTIAEIAQRESLSVAYVAKLMIVLRKSGIVESTRGQKGGYRLSRPAAVTRMDEVLDVLGGRLYPSDFCGRYSGPTAMSCTPRRPPVSRCSAAWSSGAPWHRKST